MAVRGLVAAVALFVAACGNGDGDDEHACGSQTAAIYNGSSDPAPLDLASEARSSIVAIVQGGGPLVCTGTLLSARWVLTAAHCQGSELEVQLKEQPAVKLRRTVAHPELDVMLGELASAANTDIVPITPWPSTIDEGWIGLEATLAGFGTTESGGIGQLLFAREPVAKISPTEIWVDGRGKTGACSGDSGGPLLVADESGQTRIAGVLDRGSANCLGVDVYTRLDVLVPWIEGTVRTSNERLKRCSRHLTRSLGFSNQHGG